MVECIGQHLRCVHKYTGKYQNQVVAVARCPEVLLKQYLILKQQEQNNQRTSLSICPFCDAEKSLNIKWNTVHLTVDELSFTFDYS